MLKPAKAICRQACADGAYGFQGVYSDESAIFAKLYCNDHSFAPSDAIWFCFYFSTWRIPSRRFSSAFQPRPNRAGANQVTNTTNQLSGLPFHVDIQQLCQPLCLFWLAQSLSLIMLSYHSYVYNYMILYGNRWNQWIDMDRQMTDWIPNLHIICIAIIAVAGPAVRSARARWHPHHLLQPGAHERRTDGFLALPTIHPYNYSCTILYYHKQRMDR